MKPRTRTIGLCTNRIVRALARCRRRRRGPVAAWLVASLMLAAGIAPEAHAQIDYRDFTSVDGLRFAGTAEQTDSVIDLNGVGPKLAGAVWHFQKQPVARGFATTFEFEVRDTSGQYDADGSKGGDGLAFVIQNGSPAPIGGAGGQLGYDGLRNSIAIEFDTYSNDEPGFGDPNGNHVAVHTTGTGLNSASHSYAIASNTNIPNLSDGRRHTASIEYINGALRIYLDGCQGLIIAIPFDLARRIALDNGRAWVGFTAATGSAWERHVLYSWTFNGRPLLEPQRISTCQGEAARLAPPGRFASYLWSNGARTSSIDVTRPGRYSVDVVDSTTCVPEEVTFVFDVVQSSAPRPVIGATDSLRLCAGERITLDAGAFSSWLWSTGEATREIVVTRGGTYWVSVIDSLGCTGSDTIVVTEKPRPLPTVTIVGPTTFCNGDSTVLDAGAGFASYRWSNGATTQRTVVKVSGTYTVTVTNAAGCPATSPPVTVTVMPRPYPVINPLGPTSMCRGGRVTLDAGFGYATYAWSNGATSRTIDVDTSGAFTVTVAYANGCRGTSTPIVVTVSDPPVPEIIATPAASLCKGDTITLRTRIAYASYRWSSGETSRSISVTRSGAFTVEVVDSNGCTGTSPSFIVHIDSIGVLKIRASGPTELCSGDSVTLSAPEGLASYRWSTGETTSAIVVDASGTYVLFATDSSGCSGSDSIVVTVYERPHATIGADTTICEGATAALAADGGLRYLWSPAEGLSCVDCARPFASPSVTTRYRVMVIGDGGCADSASALVTVLPAPQVAARVVGVHRAFPGTIVEVPIVVDGPIGRALVDEFTVDLAYDSWIMLLRGITLGNEMLTGWTMETLVDTTGHFTARFFSAEGRTLRDDQQLLAMRLQTFVGWPQQAGIRAQVTLADRPCASVSSAAGVVSIDSVCGLPGRLIEALDATNALSAAAPNPFSAGTTVTVTLAADALTRLDIVTSDGRVVATLLDGLLSAGAHEAQWDASSLPSGLYFARVVAGDWSRTQPLLLAR